MNFEEFSNTVDEHSAPGPELPDTLKALWWSAKGDWEQSHNIAQDLHNADGSWIHAYLHRVEGDLGNAGYWYNRANQPVCNDGLDAERDQLIHHFLGTLV